MEAPLTIVLAAGRGLRFGGGKLDAPCAGRLLGEWALEAVARAGLPAGAIVTGPLAPAFVSAHRDWRRIVNPAPEEGLGGSLAMAARDATFRNAGTMLVLLADMPLVDPDLIKAIAAGKGSAATRHPAGVPGVPALIPSRLFPALAGLSADRGASSLLAADPALRMLSAREGTLLDVDRPDDLARAEAWLTRREASLPSDRPA